MPSSECNRRARFDYEILETWEAGIALTGTEVKSLRNGKANISDAYGVLKEGEVWLLNLHIAPYEQGNRFNHEATRTRKLLLHSREIKKMIGAVERQGLTLVALEIYFKRGRAKVRLGLARGKKLHDKRAALVDLGRHLGMFTERREQAGHDRVATRPHPDPRRRADRPRRDRLAVQPAP